MSSLKLLFLGLVLVIVLISCYLSSQLPGVTDTTVSSRHSESKKPAAHVQESAAKGVLGRLLPTHVSSFEFKILSKDVCDGCFRISNYKSYSRNEPEIMIEGTTAVEITAGLYWYLKYWCGAHVSWDKTGGVQIASVPNQGSLPLVAEHGVEIQRPVPWNYYQNAVTSSYSFVWWDWTRWEKEIDWMALQGINLPLAFTGQEAIWQKVYLDFNMTAESLSNFFSGPAFLAWARMGNMHGWGGPLSQNWLNQQLVLQKKILARMVELGMTPVLPSFSGHVPEKLKEIFPSAKITRLSTWKTVDGDPRWCCNFLLYPSDPLFVDIGEAFIKKQIEDGDTFNENHPPTNDPAFISALGAAIYKAMVKADKDAVWLMQGWIFYSGYRFWKPPQMKVRTLRVSCSNSNIFLAYYDLYLALLHSVPFGKMIVINLFAEARPLWNTSDQFYGTPYIWCMQHNFGGSLEMYGVLDVVASAPLDAWLSANSTMVGVGMCMEGIEQNPVVYELMSEMAFRISKVLTQEWLKMYTRRRYGKSVHQVEEAWDILHGTLYNCTDGLHAHVVDFIVKLPDWDPTIVSIISSNMSREGAEKNNPLPEAHLWYSTQDVVKALRLFLQGGSELSGSLTYRYDLVDLTRQVLSKLANQVYLEVVTAFRNKDEETLNYQSQKFKQLIVDMDELLATDENFLLGSWLESAKKLALNPTELKQYEWNARTQVTMWFDLTETNQSELYDYANKFWSGTLKSYYLPRASSYFSHLTKSLQKKEPFNIVDWRKEWIAMSKKWQEGDELYPVTVKGDAFAISSALFEKYFGKGEGDHKNLGR